MQSMLQFLPLITILCLYTAFLRVAARLVRVSGVGWSRAFQFAGLVVVIAVLSRLVSLNVGQPPLLVAGLLGIVLHLVLGAWFFRKRALASDGQPVGWAGATKLTAVALGHGSGFRSVVLNRARTLRGCSRLIANDAILTTA